MLGKRRQIQRTTSMSQLGPRGMLSERGVPSHGGNPSLQPRLPNLVAGEQNMAIALGDGRQEELLHAQMVETLEEESGAGMNLDQIGGQCDGLIFAQPSLPTSDHLVERHISLDRSTERSPYLPPQSNNWASPTVSASLQQTKQLDSSSIPQAEFLKMCFFCNRRLGHGQDIYIYRGDVSFCSEDCRNHQISKDERKDNCSISASKKGNTPPAVNIESGGKVVSSRTAVGA